MSNVSPLAARPVAEKDLPELPGSGSGMVVLKEPSGRFWYNWTPQLIRSAEVSAMSGNLRLAADLCEWMMGDDRVMAVLDTRCDSLLGLPFSLLPQGDGRIGPRVANDLAEDWESAFPEAEVKKLIAWGVMLGVAVAQIIWTESADGSRLVPHLDVWSPRWLSFDWVTRQWMIEAVEGESSVGMPQAKRPITPGDGQWILYTPSGASRPWIHGAYRALARWTLLKQFAITDWGFLSDRMGQGIWVAETDSSKGASTGKSDQRKELAADLQSMGRNSAVALLPGQTLRLIESVARNYDSFRQQIELADNGTAVSILGQNLSTQAGSGGSIGAASLHGKTAHGRTRVDGKTLPACLRAQALERYAEINYGDPRVAPKPYWDTTPIDDEKADAQIAQMQSQADATRVAAGLNTPNEIRARRGEPPLPGGDVLREAKAAQPLAEPAPTDDANESLSGVVKAPPAEPNDTDEQDAP